MSCADGWDATVVAEHNFGVVGEGTKGCEPGAVQAHCVRCAGVDEPTVLQVALIEFGLSFVHMLDSWFEGMRCAGHVYLDGSI